MFATWGVGEWILVLVIVLIVFGVGRLPEIGGALGRAIREFRSETEGDARDHKPEKAETEEE